MRPKKRVFLSGIFFAAALFLDGCTSIVTAPIEVAGSVASAGISMVGAAGGAVVDIATGGEDDEKDD
ncbi:hypothetical protein [Nitratifractor sp.]